MSTRPTMADVAAAAGVSTMSVSYTFNQPRRVSDATKQRVRAAAARLGYKLHVDSRLGVGVLQVVDKLGQVLDRVDVVMGRR